MLRKGAIMSVWLGTNSLGYQGVRAPTPPQLELQDRAPTPIDTQFNLGTLWQIQDTGALYYLASLAQQDAVWNQLFPVAGTTTKFVTNSGNATPSAGILNILGAANNITTSGSGDTVTVAISSNVTINNVTITGTLTDNNFGAGVLVSNSGGTVTSLPGTQHQILLIPTGAGNPEPVWGSITSSDASVTINYPTSNTINLTTTGGAGGITVIHTDDGDASESGGAVTIEGGNNISVSGSGSTVTVNVDGTTNHAVQIGNAINSLTSVSPSATSGVPLISQGASADPVFGTAVVAGGGTGATSFTAYSVICGGTTSTAPLQNVSGVGTTGQVLTSNGAGVLPTWQAGGGGSGNVLTAQVTLTSAQIKALTTTPVTIVSASGPGTYNFILSWVIKFINAGSANYSGSSNNLQIGQSTSLFSSTFNPVIASNVMTGGTTLMVWGTNVGQTTGAAPGTFENAPIIIFNTGGALTGDSGNTNTLAVWVSYQVVTI
jgi:hypothetical protein